MTKEESFFKLSQNLVSFINSYRSIGLLYFENYPLMRSLDSFYDIRNYSAIQKIKSFTLNFNYKNKCKRDPSICVFNLPRIEQLSDYQLF